MSIYDLARRARALRDKAQSFALYIPSQADVNERVAIMDALAAIPDPPKGGRGTQEALDLTVEIADLYRLREAVNDLEVTTFNGAFGPLRDCLALFGPKRQVTKMPNETNADFLLRAHHER